MPADVSLENVSVSGGNDIFDQISFSLNSPSDYTRFLFVSLIAALYAYLLLKIITDKKYRDLFYKFNLNLVRSISTISRSFFGISLSLDNPKSRQDEIEEKIDKLLAAIDQSGSNISKYSEEKIVSYFEQSLKGSLSNQIENALGNFIQKDIDQTIESNVENQLISARVRLENSERSVGVRGAVSLFVGILTAIGAFIFMKDTMIEIKPNELESYSYKFIIIYASARISIAAFIIFITYFFLSLYRKSLEESKYYQAEITNIDAWLTAWSSARYINSERIYSYFASRLMEVDRSHAISSPSIDVASNEKIKLSSDIIMELISKIRS